MDCDADPAGSVESLVIDAGDAVEVPFEQYPDFAAPGAEAFTAADGPAESRKSDESDLIEECWISDRSDRDLERRLMAQEYEGLRMGRELHDSTSQLLLSLRLSVAHLRNAYEGSERGEALDEISETVRQIDQEIRAFSYLHYPAELGKGGLAVALNTLARGFADRTGLKIVFKGVCDRAPISGAASVALLRVAQEALMNVHRHARASLVRMSLVEHDDMVELSIQDDGQGMPEAARGFVFKGLGLPGMRHRLERLGGRFSIRRLKQGTKVVASLAIGRGPLPKPDGRKAEYPYHAQ